MRLFLAVFPPAEAQGAAHGLIESLRRPGDGVSWVARANLHYTLRFLGELGERGAGRAADAARRAGEVTPAFDAALGRPGAFPSALRARVLWLGLAAGAGPFVALAHALAAALERAGFEPERRPFEPHLTLGRVREREQDWEARLAAAPAVEGAWRIDRIALVQSTLSPRGSAYEVRVEAPLQGASSPG